MVTGIGIVSPLGAGADAFWEALVGGRHGMARVEVDGLGSVVACPVSEPDQAAERFGQREARRMDRSARLAVTAAALALEDAGSPDLDPERTGTAVACIHGGAATLDEAERVLLERGADRLSPLALPLALSNAPVAATARVLGLRGPSTALATACAAGADAIGAAMGMIRDGRADAVLAGGAEAPLSPMVVAGYRRLGALSRRDDPAAASRPFDRGRDGFVVAEGAAVLVLEEAGHAAARGARVLAEAAGYGSTCDAGHLTDPDRTGAGPARAVGLALADAGIAPSDVGYVNAHATSTPAGDLAEAWALTLAGLGEAPVSSTKGAHGHALGASGATEAAVAVLALHRSLLPPTRNLEDPEPDPPLRHLPRAERGAIAAALSNSFGFGGHNACLVFTSG